MESVHNHISPYRQPKVVANLLDDIKAIAANLHPVRIMEVCGGHTHSIFRFGFDQLLPKNIELLHGPGCPVCVLPRGRIDDAINLVEDHDVTLVCYGDIMRVPGSSKTLSQVRANGKDIRPVYSAHDALDIAIGLPNKDVVFFAIGFETSTPATSLLLQKARSMAIMNLSILCHHITVVPTLEALVRQPDHRIDGFIGPGHVATILGTHPFESFVQTYGIPMSISGFEPVDLLLGFKGLLLQLSQGDRRLENHYSRVVRDEGSKKSIAAMKETFVTSHETEWRGLGAIPFSGLKISPAFEDWDADLKFDRLQSIAHDPVECRCGEVLQGRLSPRNCPLFGKQCRPENPMGALMVSSEGSCSAVYRYRQHEHVQS